MKKLLICILFMLVIPVCLLFTGCSISTKLEQNSYNSTFITIKQENLDDDNYTFILVHKKTRVMYLVYSGYRKAGLTVMLDADGKPMIYEGEIE